MSMEEGVCAGCGKVLGPRANWHAMPDGRAYHHGCEPPEKEPAPPPEPKVESLTEFAERKARHAIHGRDQRTLEEDSP